MKKPEYTILETGRKIYSVTIGNLPLRKKKALKIAEFVKSLDGFVGVCPYYPYGTLVFFDTLNDAKIGKNTLNAELHPVGKNIMRFIIAKDGVPEEDVEWTKKQMGGK